MRASGKGVSLRAESPRLRHPLSPPPHIPSPKNHIPRASEGPGKHPKYIDSSSHHIEQPSGDAGEPLAPLPGGCLHPSRSPVHTPNGSIHIEFFSVHIGRVAYPLDFLPPHILDGKVHILWGLGWVPPGRRPRSDALDAPRVRAANLSPRRGRQREAWGRKPQEGIHHKPKAPRGRQRTASWRSSAGPSGLEIVMGQRSWGSRPRL